MQPIRSILVDVDAAAQVHPALERAERIAQACNARLTIVDVVSVPPEAEGYVRADLERDVANRRCDRLSQLTNAIAGVRVDAKVLFGWPVPALIQEVLREGHDLLLRSHARDLVARGPRPFGAVDMQLFRKCPCPVWAVGPGVLPARPRIVAAICANDNDPTGTEMNGRIVELAQSIASLEGGSLTLLHAWRPFAERSILNQASKEEFPRYLMAAERRAAENLHKLKELVGKDLQVELRRGTPEEVIPEFVVSQGVDLVVLGTVARAGLASLLIGNTAERLLERLPCSVLAVKPSGFVSPVRLEKPA